jgi:hypothetical protein
MVNFTVAPVESSCSRVASLLFVKVRPKASFTDWHELKTTRVANSKAMLGINRSRISISRLCALLRCSASIRFAYPNLRLICWNFGKPKIKSVRTKLRLHFLQQRERVSLAMFDLSLVHCRGDLGDINFELNPEQ